MAHFAKLDSNNNVIDVVVVNNDVLGCPESEATGITFLTNLTGHSIWKQCSYNAKQRNIYPSIGDSWDSANNKFKPRIYTILLICLN